MQFKKLFLLQNNKKRTKRKEHLFLPIRTFISYCHHTIRRLIAQDNVAWFWFYPIAIFRNENTTRTIFCFYRTILTLLVIFIWRINYGISFFLAQKALLKPILAIDCNLTDYFSYDTLSKLNIWVLGFQENSWRRRGYLAKRVFEEEKWWTFWFEQHAQWDWDYSFALAWS